MKRILQRIIVGVVAVLLMSSAMARAAGSATLVDFDGDGLSDIGVYRNGVWFIRRSLDGGITAVEWGGLPQDKPVPADYDGDGKVDHAVYRDGAWFILAFLGRCPDHSWLGWSINGCASTGRL